MKNFTPPSKILNGKNSKTILKFHQPSLRKAPFEILTFLAFFSMSFIFFSTTGCKQAAEELALTSQKSYPIVDLNDPNFSWFNLNPEIFDAEKIVFVRMDESLHVPSYSFKNEEGELLIYEAAREIEGYESSGNRSCTEGDCCRADCCNGDCGSVVGTPDLLIFIGNYGAYVTPCDNGDITGDGYVGGADQLIFFGFYGTMCIESCEC